MAVAKQVMQILYAVMGCVWLGVAAWSVMSYLDLAGPVRNAEMVLFFASIVVALDNFGWAKKAGKA